MMTPPNGRKPAISVIIPTYNWSAALRCALRSVLLQTVADFEVLIVGDGCTDDSEGVVASFNDPRLRWHNLPRNYGSQWVANNFALENARADWVAYLGHDDIWYPTHLARILETAERSGAPVVTSVMVLYGPPRSRVRGLAGMFATGAFRPGDFVPPSAFAHATSLFGDVILWRDPETVALPMDAAFLNELALSGERFGTTNELTSFKFNAAWRRDSYRSRSVAEQEAMLERIESGHDFRQTELLEVLQSVAAGLFIPVEAPPAAGIAEGEFVRRNRRFKGLDGRFGEAEMMRLETPKRFDMSAQAMPFEWHALETLPDGRTLRWSGPSPRATIDLPVMIDRDLAVSFEIVHALAPETWEELQLFVYDAPLNFKITRTGDFALVEAAITREQIGDAERPFALTIDTGTVRRPIDVGLPQDRRWLGVAVSWIELRPLAGDELAARASCVS